MSGDAHGDFPGAKSPAKPTDTFDTEKSGEPQRFWARTSPERPTDLIALQKSDQTHSDQALEHAIQRGDRLSPARLTALTSWQVRSGKEEEEEGRRGGGRKRKEEEGRSDKI